MELENTGETERSPQNTNLIDILTKLEEGIKEQNSLKYAFFRGMIYGLGTVVGATVLVALLGGIIAATVGDLKDTPLEGLIEQPGQ